jgi:hypothetical protein
MSTTLLFAELLIIGIQAGLWLFILFLNIVGLTWLQNIQVAVISDWQALIVVFLLSFLYVMGIIVDRVADTFFSKWEYRIAKEGFPERKLPLVVLRFATSRDDEHLNHQYEYNRSRMRITRSSAINFALTTILSLSLIIVHGQNLPNILRWNLGIAIFIFGILLSFLAMYSWRKLMRGYVGMVRDNYLHGVQKELHPTAQKPERKSRKAGDDG